MSFAAAERRLAKQTRAADSGADPFPGTHGSREIRVNGQRDETASKASADAHGGWWFGLPKYGIPDEFSFHRGQLVMVDVELANRWIEAGLAEKVTEFADLRVDLREVRKA